MYFLVQVKHKKGIWLYKHLELKISMLCGSLSPWHGTFLGCGWRKWPPDMEGSCKYIE